MSRKTPEFSIILAAGKGTRMGSATTPKVCFPVDGVPSVNRAIEIYNAVGVKQHVLVVGAMAGQVVETVGKRFDNALFAYQAEQLGTAHAVKVGMRAIAACGGDGGVFIVAGDRLIDQAALERLFDLFYSADCDLALLASPRRGESSQGRIVMDADSVPLAIVEMADIRQRLVFKKLRALALSGKPQSLEEQLGVVADTFFGGAAKVQDKKARQAFGPIWEALADARRALSAAELLELAPESRVPFDLPSGAARPEEVLASGWLNTSVYLVKAAALRSALAALGRDNAQQEEYLSDIVAILSRLGGKVRALKVENPNYILGFNDPAELLEVESVVRGAKAGLASPELPPSRWFRPVGEWLAAVRGLPDARDGLGRELWDELVSLYSGDHDAILGHVANYQRVLENAADIMGADTKAMVVRSPGRINAMGRHIDHQGGNCNLMTIGYETIMVAAPRGDDKVRLFNLDRENFGEREFSIGELVGDLPWDDWLSLVNSQKVSKMISEYGVDWSRYVQASLLRLQMKFSNRKLHGMDVVLWGNVPVAAGLSSSSSLVVGAAETCVALNQLDTFPSQLVTLCGEGEWFVGTRGGAADHAAVKLGQKGKIVRVKFFDFAVEESVPFPDDYLLAVCDSGVKAKKSANAKDQFNHRICCYRLGFLLIKTLFPQHAGLLHHLRDVNTRTLGVPLGWIYKILLHLPERCTRQELRAALPDEDLDTLFASHQEPPDGAYPVRGVVLFGLAEFERARLYSRFLKDNDMAELGRLMNVSHDGDRVSRPGPDGSHVPFRAPTSNSYLLNIIEDLESGELDRVARAQLQWQPGSYHCSIPAIDKMVDISLGVPGVLGAQLAGAGLGGCMMVLTHRDAVGDLSARLGELYYRPESKPAAILQCKPVAGSGALLMDN